MVSINSNGSLENDRDILVDCAWVTGYSSLSTLVIIFNSILFFSVGKNREVTFKQKNLEEIKVVWNTRWGQ